MDEVNRGTDSPPSTPRQRKGLTLVWTVAVAAWLIAMGVALGASWFVRVRPGKAYAVTAEVWDPATDTWSPAGSLDVGPGGVLVQREGQVVAAMARGRHSSAYAWSPDSNTWSRTGELPEPPAPPVEGRQVFAAGENTWLALGGAEDPVALLRPGEEWRELGPCARAFKNGCALELSDGAWLIAGETDQGFAAVRTSADGAWEDAGLPAPPGSPRYLSLGCLPDGRLVMVRPRDEHARVLTDGAWTPTSAPPSPRVGPSMTVTPDGRLLVAGGTVPADQRRPDGNAKLLRGLCWGFALLLFVGGVGVGLVFRPALGPIIGGLAAGGLGLGLIFMGLIWIGGSMPR